MDYMQELASHPDMPQALDALRLRWQELFAALQAPDAGDALEVLKKKWDTLLRRDFTPDPEEHRRLQQVAVALGGDEAARRRRSRRRSPERRGRPLPDQRTSERLDRSSRPRVLSVAGTGRRRLARAQILRSVSQPAREPCPCPCPPWLVRRTGKAHDAARRSAEKISPAKRRRQERLNDRVAAQGDHERQRTHAGWCTTRHISSMTSSIARPRRTRGLDAHGLRAVRPMSSWRIA